MCYLTTAFDWVGLSFTTNVLTLEVKVYLVLFSKEMKNSVDPLFNPVFP